MPHIKVTEDAARELEEAASWYEFEQDSRSFGTSFQEAQLLAVSQPHINCCPE